MWLTLGRYVVTNYATKKFESALTDAYENPQGEYGQMVGKLSQLGMSFALNTLSELIPEDPNTPAHPMVNSMFRRLEDHLFKGIMGAFGRHAKKVQESLGGDGGVNPMALLQQFGGAGKGGASGFGDLGGIFNLLSTFQGMTGGGQPAKQSSGGGGWF